MKLFATRRMLVFLNSFLSHGCSVPAEHDHLLQHGKLRPSWYSHWRLDRCRSVADPVRRRLQHAPDYGHQCYPAPGRRRGVQYPICIEPNVQRVLHHRGTFGISSLLVGVADVFSPIPCPTRPLSRSVPGCPARPRSRPRRRGTRSRSSQRSLG